MSEIFYGCSSLISLPDLHKWQLKKDINKFDIPLPSSLRRTLELKWDKPDISNLAGLANDLKQNSFK